jgi:hypothetical protein
LFSFTTIKKRFEEAPIGHFYVFFVPSILVTNLAFRRFGWG